MLEVGFGEDDEDEEEATSFLNCESERQQVSLQSLGLWRRIRAFIQMLTLVSFLLDMLFEEASMMC